MNEDKAEIDLVEPPIPICEVDKDEFLFYLAGRVPVAVSQFAEDCTETELGVKNTLNSRFQNELKLDHTGFLTLTDTARSNILSFANPLISDAVTAQKRGKAIVEDGDYKDAIEHYQHAESLFSEAESRLGAVGDVPEKLTRRLESVRDTHDSIQKKVVNDILTQRKFVGEQHEEKGDDAMHSSEFAKAVGEFEDAVDAFKDAKAAVETYNSQLLSPKSSSLDQLAIGRRIEGLERKLEAARIKASTDLKADSLPSQNEDKVHTDSQSANEKESIEPSNAEAVTDNDSSTSSADNQYRAELIAELQELDQKWSEIDRKLLHSVSDYHPDDFSEVFGSLDAALVKAGVKTVSENDLEPSEPTAESDTDQVDEKYRKELITELQTLDEKLDVFSRQLVRTMSNYDPEDFDDVFGSLDDALIEAGIEKKEKSDSDSTKQDADTPGENHPKKLVDEIQRVAAALEHPPCEAEIETYSNYPIRDYLDEFVSIESAVEEIPLSVDDTRSPTGPLDEAPDSSTEIPSHTDLLRELAWLKERHGKPTALEDFSKLSSYERRHYELQFGSVEDAFEVFGSETSTGGSGFVPKSALQVELEQIGDFLKRPLTMLDILYFSQYPIVKFAEKFESLTEIQTIAGYIDSKATETPPTEALLADLQRIAIDTPPTVIEYEERGNYPFESIIRQFDSWLAALNAADFDPLQLDIGTIQRLEAETNRVRFETQIRSDLEFGLEPVLLDELRRLQYEIGGRPTEAYISMCSRYPVSSFERAFGSLDEALAEIAPSASPESPDMDVEEYLKQLLVSLRELQTDWGHAPTQRMVNALGKYPAISYISTFGSWDSALHDAGINADMVPEQCTPVLLADLQGVIRSFEELPSVERVIEEATFNRPSYFRTFNSKSKIRAIIDPDIPLSRTGIPLFSDEQQESHGEDIDISSILPSWREENSTQVANDQSESTTKKAANIANQNDKSENQITETTDENDYSENPIKSELIAELQKLDEEWSKIDQKLLYSVSDYHPDDFKEEFGGLDAALTEAGVIDETTDKELAQGGDNLAVSDDSSDGTKVESSTDDTGSGNDSETTDDEFEQALVDAEIIDEPGEGKENKAHSESTSTETDDDEFEQALVDAGVIDEPGEGKQIETTSEESNSTSDTLNPDDFAAISDMQPNKRYSGELAIKLETESYAGAKKDASFEVTDASGETVRLDFWSKHGLEIPESTGTWYVMKELRLQQWEKDGETNQNLSSSRDTQWRQIGYDDSTGSQNTEDNQAKATETSSRSESATETQEEAPDESGGILGSIVSEFDDDFV